MIRVSDAHSPLKAIANSRSQLLAATLLTSIQTKSINTLNSTTIER